MLTRTQDFHLPSQTSEQVTATFPQNAAPVRGLSNFGLTRSIPGQSLSPSFKTHRGMLDHTRARLATDPFKSKNSPSLTSSTAPHSSAGFKTRSKRISLPDGQSYRPTRCAKTCTTTRAQHSHTILQREEHLTPARSSAGQSTLQIRATPDVAHCVTRPKSEM